jgi:hypothetical protein
MVPPEQGTHAFVVRFWHERREIEGALPEWRGMIEHVSSGTRRYLLDPEEVAAFIGSFLKPAAGSGEGSMR